MKIKAARTHRFLQNYFLMCVLVVGLLCLCAGAVFLIIEFRDDVTFDKVIGSVAILLAGTYFLYKLFAGWLVINLSLEPTVQRVASQVANVDFLVVNIKLSKGSNDTARLTHAAARLTYVQRETPVSIDLVIEGIRRLNVARNTIEDPDTHEIRDEHLVDFVSPFNDEQWKFWLSPMLHLAPNESTTLCTKCVTVPSQYPCQIEILVQAERYLLGLGLPGQWKAACASMPNPGRT